MLQILVNCLQLDTLRIRYANSCISPALTAILQKGIILYQNKRDFSHESDPNDSYIVPKNIFKLKRAMEAPKHPDCHILTSK